MSDFKKDVFVFVAKDEGEYEKYIIDDGWDSSSDTWKSKELDKFRVFVTLQGGGSGRADIAGELENYSDPEKIKIFLEDVLGDFDCPDESDYRNLFICTHWGGGEATSEEVERRQNAMQKAYDRTGSLKEDYPHCVFISLSAGCRPPKPQGFFTAAKITIPADWNKLADKLLPEGAYTPPNERESVPSPPAAAVSPSLQTRYERRLKELQEPFSRLEALAILCQGIDSAMKANVDVTGKLCTTAPEARRWWQCGDSEITGLFSRSSGSETTVAGIAVPDILVQLCDALTGNSDFPEEFDFSAASTALLEIKLQLLAQIDREA